MDPSANQPIVNSFLTDENVLRFILFLFGLLGSAILILAGFFIKQIFKEVKAGRTEREEFVNELRYKFRALNSYVKRHDTKSQLHDEKLSNLELNHQEFKKKIDYHADLLSRHDADISNLKAR